MQNKMWILLGNSAEVSGPKCSIFQLVNSAVEWVDIFFLFKSGLPKSRSSYTPTSLTRGCGQGPTTGRPTKIGFGTAMGWLWKKSGTSVSPTTQGGTRTALRWDTMGKRLSMTCPAATSSSLSVSNLQPQVDKLLKLFTFLFTTQLSFLPENKCPSQVM